jgi:allantoicase
MGDGWETKRSRVAGHTDAVIVRLGRSSSSLSKCVVDTTHFKGNFPESFTLEGCNCSAEVPSENTAWFALVDRTKLGPHAHHVCVDVSMSVGMDVCLFFLPLRAV